MVCIISEVIVIMYNTLIKIKEELEQIIREQSALKPFKSYDKPFVKKMIDITYYATLNQEEAIVEEKPAVAEESNEVTEDNKDNK